MSAITESEVSESAVRRLRWLCRRGMRELDQVTVEYLEKHYLHADEEEQAAFRQLLEMQDPELLALIFGHAQTTDGQIERVLHKMRKR